MESEDDKEEVPATAEAGAPVLICVVPSFDPSSHFTVFFRNKFDAKEDDDDEGTEVEVMYSSSSPPALAKLSHVRVEVEDTDGGGVVYPAGRPRLPRPVPPPIPPLLPPPSTSRSRSLLRSMVDPEARSSSSSFRRAVLVLASSPSRLVVSLVLLALT